MQWSEWTRGEIFYISKKVGGKLGYVGTEGDVLDLFIYRRRHLIL